VTSALPRRRDFNRFKGQPEQGQGVLQSSDSHKVAWGAYFAAKATCHQYDLVPEIMSRRLALWIAPPNPARVSPNSDGSFPSPRKRSRKSECFDEKIKVFCLESHSIMSTSQSKSLILPRD